MKKIKRLSKTALAFAICAALGVGVIGCGGGEASDDNSAIAEIDYVTNPDLLKDVPVDVRPKVRWWWPQAQLDSYALQSELNAVKEAGFGGVEPVLLNRIESKYLEWADAGFSAATAFALKIATSLGLKFDATLGPAWPMSSPSINDAALRLSMQDLHYGVITIDGPITFTGAVPDDGATRADDKRQKDLIAVTAARVIAEGSPTTLDPGSTIDLTSQVHADGTIQWTVPEGKWKLFGFWQRPTYQRPIGASDASKGWLVVDHLSREAINKTLDDYDRIVFGGNNAAAFRKNGGHVFEDSLEVEHGTVASGQSALVWTPEFLQEFTARRGYDLKKYLPATFAQFTFPEEGDLRVKHDYQLTVDDMYIDNHIKPIAEWAKNRGMTYRAQAYRIGSGGLGDKHAMRLATAVPSPDVESFGFGDPLQPKGLNVIYPTPGSIESRNVMDRYRQIVSGAHVSGATEISNEWGAGIFEAFGQDASDYKMLADRAFASGVTTQILHGLAYGPYDDGVSPTWPGWCTWCAIPSGPIRLQISESWSPSYPQWKHWPGLNGYMGRISALLRSGKPRVDLALIDDKSAVAASGLPSSADDELRLALIRAGYTWDAMDPMVVSELNDVSDGRLLPSGPAYKALIVNNQASLSLASARKLLQHAQRGLPVIFYGTLPQRGTGFKDPAGEDAELTNTLQQTLSLGNVRRAAAHGDLLSALEALSITADFRPAQTAEIIPVHRKTQTGDIWFLYNNSTEEVSTNVVFATTGTPVRIDPWTGKNIQLANYRSTGGHVTLPLKLKATETALLVFDSKSSSGAHFVSTTASDAYKVGGKLILSDTSGGMKQYALSSGGGGSVQLPVLSEPIVATGPWQLNATTVSPAGQAQIKLELSELNDWRNIPQLVGEAGTGIYSTTVHVPAEVISEGRGLRLDAGVVNGTIKAWINGTPVAMPTVAPFQVDITSLLKPGSNQLRFEVATTLINKVVALSANGAPWSMFSRRTTEPYGLMGPVRLVPYAYATIATP